MIVDRSALVAIVLREPGHGWLIDRLADARAAGVGAPTLAEAGIVLTARVGLAGRTLLARLVQEAALTSVPMTDEHWPIAVDAYRRYGKGSHAAGLTFGDCLTYSIAKLADEPLLCVGDAFTHTDLAVELPPLAD